MRYHFRQKLQKEVQELLAKIKEQKSLKAELKDKVAAAKAEVKAKVDELTVIDQKAHSDE